MVKIRIKLLLLSLFVLALLVNVAYASNSKLSISDVDAKIGSKLLKNLTDGETITETTRPGRTVEFRVEARNDFTRAEDLKIDDVTIKVTIENIENGDDLEKESTSFDLRPDSEAKFNFKFEIPLEVREDTYNVIITADGDDENGTRNFAEVKLKLEVDKDSHNIAIIKKELTPSEITCKRKNVQLSTTLLNIGNNDEDAVTFHIENDQLGINIEDKFGSLKALPNEPESRFSKVYSFDVPDSTEPGSYPLTLRAIYDNDRKITSDTAAVVINSCSKPQELIAKPKAETKFAQEIPETQLIMPAAAITTSVEQPQVPPDTTVSEESSFKSNAFVVGVIAAEIIALIAGIVLIIVLYARRD